jgi:hypothetical protein
MKLRFSAENPPQVDGFADSRHDLRPFPHFRFYTERKVIGAQITRRSGTGESSPHRRTAQEECDDDGVSKSVPPKDSLRDRIESILGNKKLTLHQVSKLSGSLYGHGSEYFIPHNFYYELGRGRFTPSIYQCAALGRITGYRLAHWLKVFGFDLETIPRLQAVLPAKRTLMIDSSLTDAATRIPWIRDRQAAEIPPVAPLSRLLAITQHELIGTAPRPFLYAKIGQEDALAFPNLLPGSIVGVDPKGSVDQVPDRNETGLRMFLVENSQGLFCCRLHRTSRNGIVPVSEKLPYAQVELDPAREMKILGAASFEIRPLTGARHPEVPADLARRWTPGALHPLPALGAMLRHKRSALKMSLQVASAMSRRVAEAMEDGRYFISPSALSDHEAGDAPPRHLHKAISLCAIYGVRFAEFLRTIGISSTRIGDEPMPDRFLATTDGLEGQIPADRESNLDTRCFLAELLQTIPDIPFFLRNSLDELSGIPEPSLEDFFWIGRESNPLHPVLNGGLLALVNRRKKKPVHYRAKPLWEQPIYLLLLRGGGYLCACCSQEDKTLVLHPYPQHIHGAIEFRAHEDAEVVGQIVTILRKLL